MNTWPVIAAALVAGAMATRVAAEEPAQPPMNDFYQAFYVCEGSAFLIEYDSDKPSTATMVTSNNNKRVAMKRIPASTGVRFSGSAARFWTDGKAVTVEGSAAAFKNCRMKAR
jgi:membrane-bound inhibitor of C-type lysozyme